MIPPVSTLIQFSDLHVFPEGQLMYGQLDTLDHVRQALTMVEESVVSPVALLFSGDLTEAGEASAYARLKGLVDPFVERMGIPAIWVAGNHDNRRHVRSVLLGLEPSDDEIDHVHWFDGLRVIALDSSCGRLEGEITDAQLDWLATQLATPAPRGTVLVMHHPPFPVRVTLQPFVLKEPDRLAKVLKGSDVRMLLAGHAHQSVGGAIAGIPVWVSGATSYRIDPLSPNLKGQRLIVFSRIDLYENATVATQVPVMHDVPLYEVTPEELEAQRLAREQGMA